MVCGHFRPSPFLRSPKVGKHSMYKFNIDAPTDEHGGWWARLPYIKIRGVTTRNPGIIVFEPVGFVRGPGEVQEVTLWDDRVEISRSGKDYLLEGRAVYLTEDGEESVEVQGRVSRKYVKMPANGEGERKRALFDLLEVVGDWGRPLVEEALVLLDQGENFPEDLLRGIRHRFYRSGMPEGADLFRK